MHLFGGKFCTHPRTGRQCTCEEINLVPCKCERKNFNTLLWSLVTVFQVNSSRVSPKPCQRDACLTLVRAQHKWDLASRTGSLSLSMLILVTFGNGKHIWHTGWWTPMLRHPALGHSIKIRVIDESCWFENYGKHTEKARKVGSILSKKTYGPLGSWDFRVPAQGGHHRNDNTWVFSATEQVRSISPHVVSIHVGL